MATRATLRAELRTRIGDLTSAVWTDSELNDAIGSAIEGLYPSFFQRKTATSTATAGPLQTAPATARNLHMVGLQRTGSTRVRPLRGWQEGDGQAFVPKTGITGESLVWAWTAGWTRPADDVTVLTIPVESQEVVLLRAHITLLERVITSRVKAEKYLSLSVRQATSEDDIVNTLDALHASLRERLERTLPLPEVRQ